jgi:hypothetical protein
MQIRLTANRKDITAARNLGLAGGPGTGKTLLAIAIGSAAVKQHGKLYETTTAISTAGGLSGTTGLHLASRVNQFWSFVWRQSLAAPLGLFMPGKARGLSSKEDLNA